MRRLMVRKVGRRARRRSTTTVALVLAATMALVGAACTPPPPPPADADVVVLASQQPGGIANYQNLTVPNGQRGDSFVDDRASLSYPSFPGLFVEVVSAEEVAVSASRPFFVVDGWSIACSGPSIDNGDGSFSCPADLVYVRAELAGLHTYEGQGLLLTWPDADPKLATYVGTTTYSYTLTGIISGGVIIDPTRVGQEWTEQLRFQDRDDTVTWPPGP